MNFIYVSIIKFCRQSTVDDNGDDNDDVDDDDGSRKKRNEEERSNNTVFSLANRVCICMHILEAFTKKKN